MTTHKLVEIAVSLEIIEAQRLQDKENWTGLSLSEREKLNALKERYKQREGKPMPLEYNCPA